MEIKEKTQLILKLCLAGLFGTVFGFCLAYYGFLGGAMVGTVLVALSKPVEEITKYLIYIFIGFVAGLAKDFQAIVDDVPRSTKVRLAAVGVSVIFAFIGGVASLGYGVGKELSLVCSFVAGALGFNLLKILEEKLRK